MAFETAAQPYHQVDQDKLLALLKEYAGRVREMADRLERLRFWGRTSASLTIAALFMMCLWLIAAVSRAQMTGLSLGEISAFDAVGLGLILLVLGSAPAWRYFSRSQNATERNLQVYSRQLARISQRTSELQDPSSSSMLTFSLSSRC